MSAAAWRRRALFAGQAFVVTSLVACVLVLVARAGAHRRRDPRHLVDLAVWGVHARPVWATLDDARQVRDDSGLVGSALPLYDRSAADVVHDALESAPRVRRVLSIRRVPPDRVEVTLELRRPVAALVVPGRGWAEVDADGVVLAPPQRERPVRDGLALRAISGAAPPLPEPGATCGDDVRAAIGLCRQLDAYRGGLGAHVLRTFDEVDVTNVGGRIDPAASEIVLRAAVPAAGVPRPVGAEVEWGRLAARYGEPDFEHKADLLAEAVRVFGDFDGVARVRVAFAELSVMPVDGDAGRWLPAQSDHPLGR